MNWFGERAIGIDLGDGTLKAALLSRRGQRVTLHHTWRIACDTAADPQAAALDAAAELLRRARLGSDTRIVLSAPARGVFSRTLLIPPMDAERITELVRYEVLSQTKLPDADLLIRHQVTTGGDGLAVHAVALRQRELDAFRAELASRRIEVDDLELPGCALASFVQHELPPQTDRLVLGVGRLATELVVMSGNGVWLRHLPLGLAHAAGSELAQRLKAEIDAALGVLLPEDRAFRPHDLVLSEEGALDGALTGALRKALGCPVTRIQSLARIGIAFRVRHEGQEPEQSLSMGKALGLALCGLGLARCRCPIVEGSPRRQALRQIPAVAAAVLISAGALGTAGLLADAHARRLDATLPASLQHELRDRTVRRDGLLSDRTIVDQDAAALLTTAQRRGAVFQPRRALAALASLADERGASVLHLDNLWVASGEPDHPGTMTLTLNAAPQFDAVLGDRLQRALKAEFSDVRVTGPEPAPVEGLSRWTVEVPLP